MTLGRPIPALERGANAVGRDRAGFAVWAPKVASVAVRLFTDENPRDVPLERDDRGVWSGEVSGVGVGTTYVYSLDGRLIRPDPVSRALPGGVHGPSELVDPGAFRWNDAEWKGVSLRDLVLYELHVGTFTDEGTFDAAANHLEEIVDLGVTAIELMPVAQFPGARNWGYDGVGLYAVQRSYGGPEGLRRLVDRAHQVGLGVILDVVYNHLGPEGNYLADFGPYFTDSYLTPWGPALNYDEAGSDEVRRFVLDNALYWIDEYHMDGLRLDAVHAILDRSPIHLLEELAVRAHDAGRRLGREILVVAESDRNDPRLVRAPPNGTGLDAVWADDFHHSVHGALTGERQGYYRDFSSGADDVAKALRDGFVYDGRFSSYRNRHHGAPARDVSPSRFVVFAQNHDQIGNRAAGERLSTLVGFEAQKLAAALVLLSPETPLLFMGEEWGETNPFLYFVSHESPELVAAVRAGRRREFEEFGWTGEVPDPQDEATFSRSRLDRSKRDRPGHGALLRLHGDLLRARRQIPALRADDADIRVHHERSSSTIALELRREPGDFLVGFNLAAKSARLPIEGVDGRGSVPRLWTTDSRYEGPGVPADAIQADESSLVLELPAYSAVLLALGVVRE